jgi:hypothetical protein
LRVACAVAKEVAKESLQDVGTMEVADPRLPTLPTAPRSVMVSAFVCHKEVAKEVAKESLQDVGTREVVDSRLPALPALAGVVGSYCCLVYECL